VLQETLEDLGYTVGGIDGFFGSRTDRAVRAFQADSGLTVDGVGGRVTKTALAGATFDTGTSDILSLGSRGADVRKLQSLLNESGFDAGNPDGIFGPITLRAVLSFQAYQDLWVDGLVGPKTKAHLGML
jgi:peptidoglycan hydrolase-like protein with peptidoglycan-binding domain